MISKIITVLLIFVSTVHFSYGQEMQHHKSEPRSNYQPTTVPPQPLAAYTDSRNHTQDQKDLLIVFDSTGSMGTDLAQLRAAAIEIIDKLSEKAEDPINNFILSVFNDPYVEEVFVSDNSSALKDELNKITVEGGGDCPELAVLGLKNALEVAAPNSLAFLFSDASAKDYELYEEVIQIVLKKQIRVYFLLTGDCGTPDSTEFLVYGRIASASDGQVFSLRNSDVKEVLVGLSFMLDTKYEPLKSFEFTDPGRNVIKISVDGSFETLLISGTGKNLQLNVLDTKNETVKGSESVCLGNIKIVTLNVTTSEYLIDASADSGFSIKVGGISDMSIDFGFSVKPALHLNETQKLPIADSQNILTIFVTNTRNLKCLRRVSLVSVADESQFIEIPLKKAKCGIFATALFSVPEDMFKIKVYGKDKANNVIDRIISTGIEINREECAECDYEDD